MADGPVYACESCGSGGLRHVLDLGVQPTPQAVPGRDNKRYPLHLVECPACTLVQLDYIAPRDEVFPADYPYVTGNTKALRDHFAAQASYVDSLLWPTDHFTDDGPPLVIDIGGNDGTMLKALRAEDPDVDLMLIEPTDQARKCDEPGIEVVQDYFTAALAAEIRESHAPAQVIVASNVFGHVHDVHDFLDGVNALLDRAGTFLIDNQDWHNVVQGLQIDTIYHEHQRFYTPASLGLLLDRHGLMIISWNRIGMHGGSFRAVVQRQKPDLEKRVSVVVSQLTAIMEQAAKAGPVYAVTAPTRATPLVNYAGLGKYLACACEVAGCEKIGAVIPGTDVPIVDEQALFDDQPPHAVILAWDIAGTLIPVLRKRGYAGNFIIPLPFPVVTRG
jgi:hypothetical protein